MFCEHNDNADTHHTQGAPTPCVIEPNTETARMTEGAATRAARAR